METSDPPAGVHRILLYGVTGSGKTYLAERLAEATGIPWHSVDDEIGWAPGWVEVPGGEQRRRIEEICAGPQWILDSAYGSWRDVVLSRADLVVALDYPRWFSLQRLVRRTLARVIGGRLACNGNRESVHRILSCDSIIRWHFASFDRKRARIRQWCNDPAGPPVRRLTSSRQTDAWLAGIAKAPGRPGLNQVG